MLIRVQKLIKIKIGAILLQNGGWTSCTQGLILLCNLPVNYINTIKHHANITLASNLGRYFGADWTPMTSGRGCDSACLITVDPVIWRWFPEMPWPARRECRIGCGAARRYRTREESEYLQYDHTAAADVPTHTVSPELASSSHFPYAPPPSTPIRRPHSLFRANTPLTSHSNCTPPPIVST